VKKICESWGTWSVAGGWLLVADFWPLLVSIEITSNQLQATSIKITDFFEKSQ
jgi:hypothetical protein